LNIKILGVGCANCVNLAEAARQAAAELGIQAEVTKITDPTEWFPYHLDATPGLVIDEVLVASGKPIPALDQVKELIRTRLQPTA